MSASPLAPLQRLPSGNATAAVMPRTLYSSRLASSLACSACPSRSRVAGCAADRTRRGRRSPRARQACPRRALRRVASVPEQSGEQRYRRPRARKAVDAQDLAADRGLGMPACRPRCSRRRPVVYRLRRQRRHPERARDPEHARWSCSSGISRSCLRRPPRSFVVNARGQSVPEAAGDGARTVTVTICATAVGWRGREPEAGGGCIRDMRRHLACIAVVVGVFAAPAAAPAKEISKVSVCGTAGQCTTYDESDFKSLMFLVEDAGPTDPPAAAAPWYRVRFTVDMREDGGGHDSWTVAYVPSADSLRVRDEAGDFAWAALSPRTAAVFKRAVRGLPAFPKARLRGLRVEPPQARVDEVFSPAADRCDARPDRLGYDAVGLDRGRRAGRGARPLGAGRPDPAPAASRGRGTDVKPSQDAQPSIHAGVVLRTLGTDEHGACRTGRLWRLLRQGQAGVCTAFRRRPDRRDSDSASGSVGALGPSRLRWWAEQRRRRPAIP